MRPLSHDGKQITSIPDMAMTDAAMPIATRLRFETRADHDAIEANPRLKRLMAADLTLPDYLAILVRLAGFYAPVEAGLALWEPSVPEGLELASRLVKTSLLWRDLGRLAPEFDRRDAAGTADFGTFASVEEAWGCLYVVEGSTLGGQLIARNLKATIGVTAEHGAAFHNPYGAQTGARWQAFKAILTEEVASGSLDADAVVAGARDAFRAMDRWLASPQ